MAQERSVAYKQHEQRSIPAPARDIKPDTANALVDTGCHREMGKQWRHQLPRRSVPPFAAINWEYQTVCQLLSCNLYTSRGWERSGNTEDSADHRQAISTLSDARSSICLLFQKGKEWIESGVCNHYNEKLVSRVLCLLKWYTGHASC